jgi:hypothetical protein
MGKKKVWAIAVVVIPLVLLFALGNGWAQLKAGDEAPSFVLPSSQDKLVDYYKDYYGKHHLIITFFPAAFTPV